MGRVQTRSARGAGRKRSADSDSEYTGAQSRSKRQSSGQSKSNPSTAAPASPAKRTRNAAAAAAAANRLAKKNEASKGALLPTEDEANEGAPPAKKRRGLAEPSSKSTEAVARATTASKAKPAAKKLPTLKLKNPNVQKADASDGGIKQADQQAKSGGKAAKPGTKKKGATKPARKKNSRPSKAPAKPNKPARVPKSWARNNWKYQGFAPGELEHEPKKGRKLTYAVHFAETEEDESFIFFFAHTHRFGGPFGFMSNFAPARFRMENLVSNHEFVSVEQAYQFSKCRIMANASARFTKLTIPPVSSKELMWQVLNPDLTPNQTAQMGRVFKYYEKEDKNWFETWSIVWENVLEDKVLLPALRLKFDSDPILAEMLLMTGEFRLVEASPLDSNCGIGKDARAVIDDPTEKLKKCKGKNLLGKLLEKVRGELREKHQEYPTFYAYKYWQKFEQYVAAKRASEDNELSAVDEESYQQALKTLREQWKQSGQMSVDRYAGVPKFEKSAEIEDDNPLGSSGGEGSMVLVRDASKARKHPRKSLQRHKIS